MSMAGSLGVSIAFALAFTDIPKLFDSLSNEKLPVDRALLYH